MPEATTVVYSLSDATLAFMDSDSRDEDVKKSIYRVSAGTLKISTDLFLRNLIELGVCIRRSLVLLKRRRNSMRLSFQ